MRFLDLEPMLHGYRKRHRWILRAKSILQSGWVSRAYAQLATSLEIILPSRRPYQRIQRAGGPGTTGYLRETVFLIVFAREDTISSRLSLAIGSASIAACVLRKRSPSFVTDALKFFRGRFAHRRLARHGRTTEIEGGGKDEEDDQGSHDSLI